MLKSAGANESAIKYVKELVCETCRMTSNPPSQKVARLRFATSFNEQVYLDTLEVELFHGVKLKCLNIIDVFM